LVSIQQSGLQILKTSVIIHADFLFICLVLQHYFILIKSNIDFKINFVYNGVNITLMKLSFSQPLINPNKLKNIRR